MIKLKILGVGSAFARIKPGKGMQGLVFNSNFLVEKNGRLMLIDYGRTANGAMDYFGYERNNIDHILISHLHNDHIGGMEELGILNRVRFNQKQNVVSTEGIVKKLWENSLKGGLEYLENSEIEPAAKGFSAYFDSTVIEPNRFFSLKGFEDLEIKFLRTRHIFGMESYGFILKTERMTVFLSGDTMYDEEFTLEHSENADLVLHDCQLADAGPDNRNGVHPSLAQLLNLPRKLRLKTHLYHYDLGGEKPDVANEFAGFGYAGQEFRI